MTIKVVSQAIGAALARTYLDTHARGGRLSQYSVGPSEAILVLAMLVRASRLSAVQAAVFVAGPALAAAVPTIDVPAGRLATALTVLGRQANIDILFADDLVGERRTAGARGLMPPGDALARLLTGSGLVARRTADGAFVIGPASAEPAAVILASDETIPEILVVGRRAQNSDIRRTEDDIQPYQVYTKCDLKRAHSDTIDEFFRSRLSANGQIGSPAQLGSNTRSEIDLRGLGSEQTLILVDGRRLPSLPFAPFAYNQPDVNGIPVEVVERMEVLTATAGGIYGVGATAGAVNVILRHDRGAEVSATTGLSSRGDAFQYRLFGRVGFTPDSGRTNISIAAAYSREDTLRIGDRDYISRAQQRRFAQAPDAVVTSTPLGNGINIVATQPLTLDEPLGGQALGASFTTLPLGLGSDPARRDSLLLANAGTLSLDQSPSVAYGSAVTPAQTRSILFNVRHDFGAGVEGFFDLIDTRNMGRQQTRGYAIAFSLPAAAPVNPFQQAISVVVPSPISDDAVNKNVNSLQRITAGLIVPLPADWRANLEFVRGHARVLQTTTLQIVPLQTTTLQIAPSNLFGGFGAPPAQSLDPFGDWTKFESDIKNSITSTTSTTSQTASFRDASLRLAGPFATLAGGKATLSVLAEERRESVASPVVAGGVLFNEARRVPQRTQSLYAEARLPISSEDGWLKNLRLQLAARQDWTRTILPGSVNFQGADSPRYVKRDSTTLYTVGGQFEAAPGLSLRASTATGALPPTSAQLGQIRSTLLVPFGLADAKRGDRAIGSESTPTITAGGRQDLRPERARSLSIGALVMPREGGPRFAIDFTRIIKHDEIVAFTPNVLELIANEDRFPGRVNRGALTEADRALGFTSGPITNLDITADNVGKTRIDSVDFSATHSIETGAGVFDAYLRATWEPTYRQRDSRGGAWIDRVGYSDGPLAWRGNAGLDWSRGRFTLGFNAQYYDRYRVADARDSAATSARKQLEQGTRFIPAQVYMDFSATYRIGASRGRSEVGPELRWTIINAFDHRPPTVADPTKQGYSYYGDPRRRLVRLTLDIPFLN